MLITGDKVQISRDRSKQMDEAKTSFFFSNSLNGEAND